MQNYNSNFINQLVGSILMQFLLLLRIFDEFWQAIDSIKHGNADNIGSEMLIIFSRVSLLTYKSIFLIISMHWDWMSFEKKSNTLYVNETHTHTNNNCKWTEEKNKNLTQYLRLQKKMCKSKKMLITAEHTQIYCTMRAKTAEFPICFFSSLLLSFHLFDYGEKNLARNNTSVAVVNWNSFVSCQTHIIVINLYTWKRR